MPENYSPSPQTLVFIACFLAIYITALLRQTLKGKIDFYDFILLATVGVIPAIFAFFSGITLRISHLMGVSFPFVVMFGVLFFVVFFFLYRLVIRINALAMRERQLSQAMALLAQKSEGKGP